MNEKNVVMNMYSYSFRKRFKLSGNVNINWHVSCLWDPIKQTFD